MAERDAMTGAPEEMDEIARGSIVVANLHSPREKIWGQVVRLTAIGLTIRGIDLGSFDDWVSEVARNPEEPTMGLTTLFVPLHRIEKIVLDTDVGSARSCSAVFLERTGIPIIEHLSA